MADNDRLNTFLTQLAEFDPQTLDSLAFTRQQFGDAIGQDVFGQLFNPVTDSGRTPISGGAPTGLQALRTGADPFAVSPGVGFDPQQFFSQLLQTEGDDFTSFGRNIFGLQQASGGTVQNALGALNRLLGGAGIQDLGELRSRVQAQLGLLEEPPMDMTNVITERNPLGQSPFARTPTRTDIDLEATGARTSIGQARNQAIQQGRQALAELQNVPASQVSEEERLRRQREIERQTLEARRGQARSGAGVGVPGGGDRGTGINIVDPARRTGL